MKQKIKFAVSDTYMSMIRNSVGSNTFRNLYVITGGNKVDIARDGDLSCAIFVSSILYLFKLIKKIHATVDGTVEDLLISGWGEIEKPKIGSVLIWSEKFFESGEKHKHIGFYIGNNKAISNSSKLKHPIEHHWYKYNGRKLESVFWHPKLKNE